MYYLCIYFTQLFLRQFYLSLLLVLMHGAIIESVVMKTLHLIYKTPSKWTVKFKKTKFFNKRRIVKSEVCVPTFLVSFGFASEKCVG